MQHDCIHCERKILIKTEAQGMPGDGRDRVDQELEEARQIYPLHQKEWSCQHLDFRCLVS